MDVSELREELKQLTGAVHGQSERIAVITEIIKTHEARSIALQLEQKEMRLELAPVKQHVAFVSIGLKTLGAVAVGALIQVVLRYLL